MRVGRLPLSCQLSINSLRAAGPQLSVKLSVQAKRRIPYFACSLVPFMRLANIPSN